jgi:hypothetical protein
MVHGHPENARSATATERVIDRDVDSLRKVGQEQLEENGTEIVWVPPG